MGTASWPSASDSEVIEVDFIKLNGESRSVRLLVDSGFTGKSSFVLSEDAIDLIHADYGPRKLWVRFVASRTVGGSRALSPHSHSVEC